MTSLGGSILLAALAFAAVEASDLMQTMEGKNVDKVIEMALWGEAGAIQRR